jgi:hypothetical protein
MPIAARFAVSAAPTGEGIVWSTTYSACRRQLVDAGLASPDQFPRGGKARSSANGGHPEAGRWYLWQERPDGDVWSITYYSAGFIGEIDADGLRRLQRHLLHELQITPETIGAIVLAWRSHAARQNP